jgi:hypothetical protein
MKALPVIIAVVAVVALIRLGLRRGRGTSPRVGTVAAGFGGRELLGGGTGLVAAREIRERVRGRIFRVVTVILFGVVTAAVVVPTLRAGTATSQRVGVVASPASLKAGLQDLAQERRAVGGAGQ